MDDQLAALAPQLPPYLALCLLDVTDVGAALGVAVLSAVYLLLLAVAWMAMSGKWG